MRPNLRLVTSEDQDGVSPYLRQPLDRQPGQRLRERLKRLKRERRRAAWQVAFGTGPDVDRLVAINRELKLLRDELRHQRHRKLAIRADRFTRAVIVFLIAVIAAACAIDFVRGMG